MRKEIQAEWVARLRAKDTFPMRGALKHQFDSYQGTQVVKSFVCYDALGILVEIYREHMLKQYKTLGQEMAGEWVRADNVENYLGFRPHGSKVIEFSCLPDCVRVWAKMRDSDPIILPTRAVRDTLYLINLERKNNGQEGVFLEGEVAIPVRRLMDRHFLSFPHLASLIEVSRL